MVHKALISAFLPAMFLSITSLAAPGSFRFLTDSLPEGTTNANYNTRIVVANATGAVSFEITADNDPIPAGLSLDAATGYITGIPTSSTNANINVKASDDNGAIKRLFALKISSAGGGGSPAVHFTTNSLADGRIGQAYSVTLVAAGGSGSNVFISSGLPIGLSLNGDTGVISGIPGEMGTFFVTLTARDTNDDTKSVKILPLTILPSTSDFRFTTLVFDNGEVGSDYSDTYETSGAHDGHAVTYTVTGLPPGLLYDPLTGAVTGVPTTAGTYIVTVKAYDGNKRIGITQRMIIAPSAASNFYWNYTGLPAATINTDYTNQPPVLIASENGTSVTYSATGLPDGLTYDSSTGEIAGIPAGPIGVYPVVFTATDTGPDPEVAITMNAEMSVMGPTGGDVSSIPSQFFVMVQTYKRSLLLANSDSWSATILYNADRTTGNAFDPSADTFHLDLGDAEILLNPGDLVAVSPVLYTYANVPTLLNPKSVSVKIYADKQQIKIKTSHDALTDDVPNELVCSLTLGDSLGRIKEYLGVKGKFTIFTSYRNTGFAVAKAKLIRLGAGLDSAQIQVYLASPSFKYNIGDTVRIRLIDSDSNVLVDKDATALVTGTKTLDAATQATVYTLKKSLLIDTSLADNLKIFRYGSKTAKMDFKIAYMDLSLLADTEENLTVEITIGDTVYTSLITLFDPDNLGKFTEKMPLPW